MQTVRAWRILGVVLAAYTGAGCASAGPESVTTPPTLPPPAPSVRIQYVDSAGAWRREMAIGDTMPLRAIYHDAAGKPIHGKTVTSWSLERPSSYYMVRNDGVVVALKAGDGASHTLVGATIDGVKGYTSMNYRVLGWLTETTVDLSGRVAHTSRLAARIPAANPPESRRQWLNSDWDAVFYLRCREQGGLELRLALPAMAATGDVTFEIAGAEPITERWIPSADGYSLLRPDDARNLLGRLMSPREFNLKYRTADGRTISGLFPARDPAAATAILTQGCR
jgi:hypothetical protein